MKHYTVVITPAGLDDLVGIYEFIADQSKTLEVV